MAADQSVINYLNQCITLGCTNTDKIHVDAANDVVYYYTFTNPNADISTLVNEINKNCPGACSTAANSYNVVPPSAVVDAGAASGSSLIGNTDISTIGDGTITGAIYTINAGGGGGGGTCNVNIGGGSVSVCIAVGSNTITNVQSTVTGAIGNVILTTTAQTLSGGITELKNLIGTGTITNVASTFTGALGNTALGTYAATGLSGAVGGQTIATGYLERSLSGAIGTQSVSTAATSQSEASFSGIIGNAAFNTLSTAGLSGAVGNVALTGFTASGLSGAIGANTLATAATGQANSAQVSITNIIGNSDFHLLSATGITSALGNIALGTYAATGLSGAVGTISIAADYVELSLSGAVGSLSIATAATGQAEASFSGIIGNAAFNTLSTAGLTGAVGNVALTGFTASGLSGAIGDNTLATAATGQANSDQVSITNIIGNSDFHLLSATGITSALGNTALGSGYTASGLSGAIGGGTLGASIAQGGGTAYAGITGQTTTTITDTIGTLPLGNYITDGAGGFYFQAINSGDTTDNSYTTLSDVIGNVNFAQLGSSISDAMINGIGPAVTSLATAITTLETYVTGEVTVNDGAGAPQNVPVNLAIGNVNDLSLANTAKTSIVAALGTNAISGGDGTITGAIAALISGGGGGCTVDIGAGSAGSACDAIGANSLATAATGQANSAQVSITNIIGNSDFHLLSAAGITSALGNIALGTYAATGLSGAVGGQTIATGYLERSLSGAIGTQSVSTAATSQSEASFSGIIGNAAFNTLSTAGLTGAVGNVALGTYAATGLSGAVGGQTIATGYLERSLSGAIGTASITTSNVASIGASTSIVKTTGPGRVIDTKVSATVEVSTSYVDAAILFCLKKAMSVLTPTVVCTPAEVCGEYTGSDCTTVKTTCTSGCSGGSAPVCDTSTNCGGSINACIAPPGHPYYTTSGTVCTGASPCGPITVTTINMVAIPSTPLTGDYNSALVNCLITDVLGVF